MAAHSWLAALAAKKSYRTVRVIGFRVRISEEVSKGEAEDILADKTEGGKKNAMFDDIYYYAIFPADTKILFGANAFWRKCFLAQRVFESMEIIRK